MARVSLAVTSLLCFLVFSGVRAAPDRNTRATTYGSCSPSCGNQIRLSNGCSGTLEVWSWGDVYGTATDRNFGANEARVACRQLGCLTNGTEPVRTNTREGVNNIYQGFGFRCNGNEPNLASCQGTGAYVSRDYGIALACGGPTAGAASIFGLSAYILSLFSAIIAAYLCM